MTRSYLLGTTKSNDGYTFWTPRTPNVTTAHLEPQKWRHFYIFVAQSHANKKTPWNKPLHWPDDRGRKAGKQRQLYTLTGSYLLGPPEVTTVTHFEDLEPRKWRQFYILVPQSHTNKKQRPATTRSKDSTIEARKQKSNDCFALWQDPLLETPKVKTVTRSEDLELQKFVPQSHANKQKNTPQQPAPMSRFSSLESRKVTTVLDCDRILSPWNTRSNDSCMSWKPRSSKVTTILHFGTPKPCERQKIPRDNSLQGADYQARKPEKLQQFHKSTGSCLLGTPSDDSYMFWSPRTSKVTTILHFVPQSHANKNKTPRNNPLWKVVFSREK